MKYPQQVRGKCLFDPFRGFFARIEQCPGIVDQDVYGFFGIDDLSRDTPDILHEAGKKKGDRLLVGFALETENGVENARKKLAEKNLDYIILNNALEVDAGFQSDSNRVTILSKGNAEPVELPSMSKQAVAGKIIDMIIDRVTGA